MSGRGVYPSCEHCGAGELGTFDNPCGYRGCPGSVAKHVTTGQWIVLALGVAIFLATVIGKIAGVFP